MTDMSSVTTRILLTLAYSDQFAHPLTTAELYTRFISPERTIVPAADFFTSLTDLYSRNLVSYSGGMWSTRSQVAAQKLLQLRAKRNQFSAEKLAEAAQLLATLAWLPWVRGVAITGSAAVMSADAEDDLDFMLVTQRNRLWLVRVVVVVLAILAGKRRTWQREEPNSWCFNLWLEEQQIAVPQEHRSLYTAYEVLQTRWVSTKPEVSRAFYTANSWIQQFLPHAAFSVTTRSNTEVWLLQRAELLLSPVFDLLNAVAYLLQLAYMQRHKTRERVGFSFAFFHPRDTKQSLMSGWKERIAAQF